jgi:hypothetical protein
MRKWRTRWLGLQVTGWLAVACSTGTAGGSDADGGHEVLGSRGGADSGEDVKGSRREGGTGAVGAGGQGGGGAMCTPAESTVGLVSPGGYAAMYGCHPTLRVMDADCGHRSGIRQCDAASSELASDLPCGTCSSGDRCLMAVKPVCDCDGAGGEPPFVQDPGTGLVDGWICECRGGTWACYLLDQSGSSCFLVCDDAGDPR